MAAHGYSTGRFLPRSATVSREVTPMLPTSRSPLAAPYGPAVSTLDGQTRLGNRPAGVNDSSEDEFPDIDDILSGKWKPRQHHLASPVYHNRINGAALVGSLGKEDDSITLDEVEIRATDSATAEPSCQKPGPDNVRQELPVVDIFAEYEKTFGSCMEGKPSARKRGNGVSTRLLGGCFDGAEQSLGKDHPAGGRSTPPGDGEEGPRDDKEYPVERLLEKWEDWFLLLWDDGTCSWVHRDNISPDLVNPFEATWSGYDLGVDVLGSRRQRGKISCRVRFKYWPARSAICWVWENQLSPTKRDEIEREGRIGKRGGRAGKKGGRVGKREGRVVKRRAPEERETVAITQVWEGGSGKTFLYTVLCA